MSHVWKKGDRFIVAGGTLQGVISTIVSPVCFVRLDGETGVRVYELSSLRPIGGRTLRLIYGGLHGTEVGK